METQSSILAQIFLTGYSPWGHKELDTTECFTFTFQVDSKGQGSLACCSPWDLQESDTT